jgi:hypothetical protein
MVQRIEYFKEVPHVASEAVGRTKTTSNSRRWAAASIWVFII